MVAAESSLVEKPIRRMSEKNQVKPPKNIHKSEREKMKRGCLNELFLELDATLDPTQQNNGKAFVLSNAIKILKDLHLLVESLKKENTALLREEKYVSVERDELKGETVDLSSEIEKMQNELREKQNPVWQNGSAASMSTLPQYALVDAPTQQANVISTACATPLCLDLHLDDDDGVESTGAHQVSRPHARYPTRSDLWANPIVSELQTCQDEGRSSISTTLRLF